MLIGPQGSVRGMDVSDLRIFTEPQQGASHADLVAVAQRAEALGYGAFFRSDHFLKMGGVTGLPGPSDAWVSLAGIAVQTERIRLGTLVTSATFRHPGPLAISVAQVDEMSAGRVEFGLGAGWYEAEHQAYGIPFCDLGGRFDRLSEQLDVITGLWRTPLGETFSYTGQHYQLVDSPGLPKPIQPGGPPIIIGGRGATRTPMLAARHAAEFNLPFGDLNACQIQQDRVRAACERIDRDPDSMVWSAALVACVGADEAEVNRRAAAIGRDPAELRANGVAGTAAEAAETLATWRAAGVKRIYLQILDLADLDHMDLIAETVTAMVQ
jgi:F420-dependent oxidoreductase-like protein